MPAWVELNGLSAWLISLCPSNRMGRCLVVQKRRVDIAGTCSIVPFLLLFLDEPTAGAGHSDSGSIWSLLKQIQKKEEQMTIVLTTHYLNEAN